jgi:Dolichyl-phosphate-mannose-protein mannosyltransferase
MFLRLGPGDCFRVVRMHSNGPTPAQLTLIFLASSIPRVVGALWLPNAFGDAYAYTEQIYYLRRALLNGSFSISNLFGFWLPLYQIISAAVSAIVGSPFYVPKLISAIFGGGVCVLVFVLTWELTCSRWASMATAVLVALNPYHLIYSSSAMTDVPHAFFILLCAYCCIKDRWLLASACALAAGLIRVESWTLIPIIPLAYFLRRPGLTDNVNQTPRLRWSQRVPGRVLTSALLGLCVAAGPLFWLYVSWQATGSFNKYFEIRNTYIVETLTGNPWLASFSISRVAFDLLRLVYTTHPLVIYAALVLLIASLKRHASDAPGSLFRKAWQTRELLRSAEGLLLTFFCSHLAFLLLAYCTNNQPEIWPRYGLIFFTLGLPLLASRLTKTANTGTARVSRAFNRTPLATTYVTAILFAIQFCAQLVDVTRIVIKSDANVIAAEFLEEQRQGDPTMKIYCEDGAIRVLSGIPLEEFRDQYNSPADEKAFLQSLKANQVRFLVYKDLPGTRLPELISKIRSGRRSTDIMLEEVVPAPRRKTRDKVIIYRVHESEVAHSDRRRRVRR